MIIGEKNYMLARFGHCFAWGALKASLFLVIVGCSGQDQGDRTSESSEFTQDLRGDDGVQTEIPSGVVAQTAAEALEMDLGLIAEARGWSVEEARLHHQAAEAVGRVAIKLAEERPELFVGSVVGPDPGGRPSLLVKGEITDYLLGLVAEESIAIDVVANQPFSAIEIDQRIQRVHEKLEALGYSDFSIAADIQLEGRLLVTVHKESGLPSTPEGVVAAMPAELGNNPNVIVSDVQVGTLNAAFGGMRVVNSTGGQCTSGWTVGTYTCVPGNCFWQYHGVTTSGHCSGIDEIRDPANGNDYDFAYAEGGVSSWGDIERHTTSASMFDDFYATSTDIRDVIAREPAAGISVGEGVCLYSRINNLRGCSFVNNTNMDCGTGALKQVHMDNSYGSPGDSGSGYSFQNTAFGSNTGTCWVAGLYGDFWSVVDYFDEDMGADSYVIY